MMSNRNSNSEYQNTHLAIKEWPDQLTVLQLLYEADDLKVKYVDDENEQIRINSQDDYDYAMNMAANCFNNELRLILNDSRGKLVAKVKLNISKLLPLHASKSYAHKFTQTDSDSIATSANALDSQLIKLKEDILRDFEHKLNTALSTSLNNQSISVNNNNNNNNKNLMSFSSCLQDDLDAYFDATQLNMTPDEFSARVAKLLKLRAQAHLNARQLKFDFVEEELHLSRAFDAEFVQDFNMPDGSVCEPNVRFKKTWLIKNTGKLEWSSESFPIKLLCVSGNIYSANGDSVDISHTKLDETTRISVDLIAPSLPGNYFSEWVLSCEGFKFGPKIWCSIEVAVASTPAESKRNSIQSIDSELKSLRSQLSNSLIKVTSAYGKEMLVDLDPKHFDDYDDDEFVVVPDCFDLKKKWTPSLTKSKTANSSHNSSAADDSISLVGSVVSDKSSSSKFIYDMAKNDLEVESSKENSILVESARSSLMGSRSTLTSENQSIASQNATSKSENDKTLPSIPVENDTEHEASSTTPKSLAAATTTAITTKHQLPLSIEATTMATAGNHHVGKKMILSPIDIMKNAFSNFSGPSYVGYVGDLVPHESNAASSSSSSSSATAMLSSEKENIEKLVQMGFANRNKNERLLKKYNNDLERVVKHLIEQSEGDWSEHRH